MTGIIEKHDEITKLLHEHNAFAFWDFATAGPYIKFNLTNKNDSIYSKDAIFIATHKFMAGPNSPGILASKINMFQNNIPVIPGLLVCFFNTFEFVV